MRDFYNYQYNNIPFNRIFNDLLHVSGDTINFSTFDIETYTDAEEERAYTYALQFFLFEKYFILIRKWDHFIHLLNKLNLFLKQRKLKTVIYVHNLAYEFVFMYPYIKNKISDYFAKDNHAVLYVEYDKTITFKCSYQLTNLSLKKFLENEKVESQYQKLGNFDYQKKRFFNTKIKRFDYVYMRNDVVGLAKALRYKLEKEKKTIIDFPLTSTGYVRKDIKTSCPPQWSAFYEKNFNTYNNYVKIKKTIRGGDTHGNRFEVGKININVWCYDICSSYPYQLLAHKYPLKKFKKGKIEDMKKHKHAFCCKIKLYNGYTTSLSPYISLAKCEKVKSVKKDNGRVVSFGYIETYVNDIDYFLILKEYNFEKIEVTDLIYSYYEKLPNYIINIIKEYFETKQKLKGVDDYFYMKAKNLLNSIYGCMATSIVFDDYKLKEGTFEILYDKKRENYNKEKKKQKQPFIGSWVTAYARAQLRKVINICGEKFLYCDTDSVYFKYDEKIIKEIEKLNKLIDFISPIKGTKIGQFEKDKVCREFKFLGAKKYAYVDDEGKIKITVAGVPKSKKDLLKSLDDFKEGMIFEKSNCKAVYDFKRKKKDFYKGHVQYDSLSSLALIPTDYTLNFSDIDKEVIIKKWLMQKKKNIIH